MQGHKQQGSHLGGGGQQRIIGGNAGTARKGLAFAGPSALLAHLSAAAATVRWPLAVWVSIDRGWKLAMALIRCRPAAAAELAVRGGGGSGPGGARCAGAGTGWRVCRCAADTMDKRAEAGAALLLTRIK